MSLRINIKQGETFELINVNTHQTIKVKCVAGKPMQCDGCVFASLSSNNNEICGILNCNGNYRPDKTFVKFKKVYTRSKKDVTTSRT